MTYREKFRQSIDWRTKVLTMELFHLLMLSKKREWNLTSTARYFGVSIALVSENLKLSGPLKDGLLDECNSRDKALKLLRNSK